MNDARQHWWIDHQGHVTCELARRSLIPACCGVTPCGYRPHPPAQGNGTNRSRDAAAQGKNGG